ncbi:hypothetical protein [Streptomyces sp. 142MFCol3.1]|uniref:hypothetical protein n=1 Tax=Streptomyces sp. 142MFCol3.1 TaxID=1172179 RepID=UPI000422D621|nr:hypothetical protein [Streptomyces sp. 142MFCol3.1]
MRAPAREPLREVLVATVDELVGDGGRRACLIVGAAAERIARDQEAAAQVRPTTASLEGAPSAVIAEAQADGHLPNTRDAGDVARYRVVTMHGLRVMGAVQPGRTSLMAVVEAALRALE